MNTKDFGEKVAALRRARGLTQSQLAEQLNISNKAISRWETGEGYPEITLLVPLANALEVSVDQLLGNQRPETQQNTDSAQDSRTRQPYPPQYVYHTKKSKKSKESIDRSMLGACFGTLFHTLAVPQVIYFLLSMFVLFILFRSNNSPTGYNYGQVRDASEVWLPAILYAALTMAILLLNGYAWLKTRSQWRYFAVNIILTIVCIITVLLNITYEETPYLIGSADAHGAGAVFQYYRLNEDITMTAATVSVVLIIIIKLTRLGLALRNGQDWNEVISVHFPLSSYLLQSLTFTNRCGLICVFAALIVFPCCTIYLRKVSLLLFYLGNPFNTTFLIYCIARLIAFIGIIFGIAGGIERISGREKNQIRESICFLILNTMMFLLYSNLDHYNVEAYFY